MPRDDLSGPNPSPSQASSQGGLVPPVEGSKGPPPSEPDQGRKRTEVSNSRPSAKSGSSDSAGADTVRFLFRVSDTAAHTFAQGHRRDLPVVAGVTGELQPSGLICGPTELAEGKPAVWVEGRPDQLFHGKGHDALLPVDRLPEADEMVRESLSRIGVDLAKAPTEVGRIDTTASLRLSGPPEMQAVLRAFRDGPPPRRKTATYEHRGSIQTVNFVGVKGRKVHERIYCEGGTHGAERSRFLRFEAQNRYPSRKRLPVSEWSPDRAADTFARKFATHRERVGTVTIGNADDLCDEVARLHREGLISSTALVSLIGYLLQRRRGHHLQLGTRTVFRYEGELARLGLSYDPEVQAPIKLDLQALVDRSTAVPFGSPARP